jgi:hypothetical protein
MLRMALLLTLLLGALAAGCADGGGSGTVRGGAQNPNPPAEGIGPNGAGGAPARDMPGSGRGSMPTSHGK